MKSALAASFALALVLALGACSDDTPDAASPATASDTEAGSQETPATDGVISPVDLPADPTFSNKAQGVIRDVAVKECTTGPGAVTASGTATNSGDFKRDVVVTVSWTVGSTGDVVAKAVGAVRNLKPGESGDWSVDADVPGDLAASCVTLAQAGQLKG